MNTHEYLTFHKNCLKEIISAPTAGMHLLSLKSEFFYYLKEDFKQMVKSVLNKQAYKSDFFILAHSALYFISSNTKLPFESIMVELVRITETKNNDYTGQSNDPFDNFKFVEKMLICSVEQGFLARMSDKIKRIQTWVKKGELKVKDESVNDSLMDLINYAILLYGYLVQKGEVKS